MNSNFVCACMPSFADKMRTAPSSICGRVGDPACIYKTMGIKIYEAASCENKL